MRRIDNDRAETHFSVLVYGRTGSGKTSLAATCNKPLVLLSERQGQLHLRESCARNGVPVPPVFFTDSIQDYRDVVRALHGKKSDPFRITSGNEIVYEGEWPGTIVLDSLTAIGQMIADDVDEQAGTHKKLAKDGLPQRQMRAWTTIDDRFHNLVLAFRDAPVDVLFLALAQLKEGEDDDGGRWRDLQPVLPMAKLGEKVAAACNAVGYAYRTEERAAGEEEEKPRMETRWRVRFKGPEYMLSKACGGLGTVEDPDFSAWRIAIEANLAPTNEEAPAPEPEKKTRRTSRKKKADEAPEPAAEEAPQREPGEEG